MSYDSFRQRAERAAESFKSTDPELPIRIISHLDADGLSAAAVLMKALSRENRRYAVSVMHYLEPENIRSLSLEPYKCFIFVDIGSGQLSAIKEHLSDRKVFVLDHHQPEDADFDNLVHLNPHLDSIDGSSQICGSGVTYLFAESLNKRNRDLAHLAVLGMIGDSQDDSESELNEYIIDTAVAENKMEVVTGLRMFGAYSRPMHKVLEYSTDPYIPGVSGSESGAVQFLHEIGIKPKSGSKWRKMADLNQDEMQKLVAGIVMQRITQKRPEDILGRVYLLKDLPDSSPLRDAKEFATLLNACGRLNRPSVGIGACLGYRFMEEETLGVIAEYKRALMNLMRWFEENRNSSNIRESTGYVIINTQQNVQPTMIGTMASMLARSNQFRKGTFIVSMAHLTEHNTKVSIRISGQSPEYFQDINLMSIIKELAELVGGTAGGHQHAAGAIIPTEKENVFIDEAESVLQKLSIEEKV